MFSFGWSEIALTVAIIIVVIGPKEIPNLLRQLGHFSKSLKKLSREFKTSISDLAEEESLIDIKKSISEIKNLKDDVNLSADIKKEINSIKETTTLLDKEIKKIDKEIAKP
jgi:sec-independent protein translocase protein TatB